MGRVKAVLVLAVFSLLVLLNVGSVWALTVAPSPIAGQSFTITNGSSTSDDDIGVFTGSGCANGNLIPGIGGSVGHPFGSISLTLHAGQYSAQGILAINSCVDFTVSPASPTTAVSCLSSTLNVGSMTTCTATISGSAFGPSTVDGDTISWSDAGSVSFSVAMCTLSGGSCSVTVTGTGAGPVTVTGSFSGDGDNNPSSGTFPLTINAAPPIPEYPLGVPLLALLTVIAYGVIRRRTHVMN